MSASGDQAARSSEARAAAERELVLRWKRDGDVAARDELVQSLMPFVRSIASGFSGRGEPPEDLVQVGAVGLLKAIDRFDPDRGVRVSTYAEPNISGEIRRYFRDRTWSVHVTRGVQELHTKIARHSAEVASRTGRQPTVKELVAALDSTEEQVLEALDAGRNHRAASLDAQLEGDEPRALATRDAGFENAERRADLESGLDALQPRERRIVLLRFAYGLTQREIADVIGISQMHVSRLLRESIEVMREVLLDDGLLAALDNDPSS